MKLPMFVEQGLTVGGIGVWTLVVMFALALVRIWPVLKQRALEARKLDSDVARELRDELLKRLDDCEEKHAQLNRNYETLLAEREHDRRRMWAMQDVISLMLTELIRKDPGSDVILRAKALLEVGVNSPPPDAAMRVALDRLGETPN